jgi:hypothetical protein
MLQMNLELGVSRRETGVTPSSFRNEHGSDAAGSSSTGNHPAAAGLAVEGARETHSAVKTAQAQSKPVGGGFMGGTKGTWLSMLALVVVLVRVLQREGQLEALKHFFNRKKYREKEQEMLETANSPLRGKTMKDLAEEAARKEREEDNDDEGSEPDQECELIELPPPEPRLRQIGASFVIPLTRIAQCTQRTLSFDIPTLPAVWPLRAVLSRPLEDGPWTKIELTVDIIAAADLPPLLCCTLFDTEKKAPPSSGSTGGTGTPDGCTGGGAIDLANWAGHKEEQCGDKDEIRSVCSTDSNDTDGCCGGSRGTSSDGDSPWLLICNGSGTTVASIMHKKDGVCILQRQDQSQWEIRRNLEDEESPTISVSRRSQDIGKGSSLGTHKKEEHLQVDTLPDTESPESALLLMCMLSTLVFKK